MKRQPSLKALEKKCADFNAGCPIGARVVVRKDNGEDFYTNTRSSAFVLSGHTAVIMLAGISGAYDLARVRPV